MQCVMQRVKCNVTDSMLKTTLSAQTRGDFEVRIRLINKRLTLPFLSPLAGALLCVLHQRAQQVRVRRAVQQRRRPLHKLPRRAGPGRRLTQGAPERAGMV